jgi:predicted metal-dependent hydrolase
MKERFDGKIFIRQSAADFAEKKAAALLLITEKAERFNAFYKFAYASIRIKNQRSRWGSCSSKGNLNFNYSLIYLPSHLADYVVVHELCHLKALNHGPSFWNLVKEAMPDYALRRRELRQKYVAYAVK